MSDMDDEEGGAEVDESWMGTFSDLCLLLLVFFVLMVSMASMETIKFENFFGSMRDAFGAPPMPEIQDGAKSGTTGAREYPEINEFLRIREQLADTQALAFNEIKSYLEMNALPPYVSARWKDGLIVLDVPEGVLFAEGAEELQPEAGPVLTHLLNIFQIQRNMSINIKGYTDDTPPPPGARYADFWELSVFRAANVLQWYLDQGIPVVRLTATGMGNLEPVAPNNTPEGRAKNRRVEFVLERKVGN